MRRWTKRIGLGLAGLAALAGGIVAADHLTGINIIPVVISNQTGSALNNQQLPFHLSSISLSLGGWMDADALDTDVLDGSDHAAYMPGTGLVRMLACFNNAAGDETAACNDATANDITLPAADTEVFEFAADNQFRHLHLDISTPAVADWEIEWQYWNGSSYVALSNVSDGTNHFQNSDAVRVSWDFPAAGAWPRSTLNGVAGYWVRAEVAVFTSVSQAPLGRQAGYETGRWWVFAESIGAAEQKRFDLETDIPASPVTEQISISSLGADGRTQGSAGIYPPPFSLAQEGDSLIGIARTLQSGTYTIRNSLQRWDTSGIPDDATVTSASITCATVDSPANADNRNLVFEWHNWDTPLGGRHYAVLPQATANITPLSELPAPLGTQFTFELSNLHHINKLGFTGLRGHIDGGQPTGANSARVSGMSSPSGPAACSLSVTYDVKQYHHYFPHEAGYTLDDHADLEPGLNYHLKLAGYFDMAPTGAARDILTKGPAYILRAKGDEESLEVVSGGVLKATVPLSTGFHLVEVVMGTSSAGPDRLIVLVNGDEAADTTPGGGVDNSTPWELHRGEVVRFLEYYEHETGQTTRLTHQIRDLPDYQLVNHANPGTFDAIARYPDTPAGFTSQVLPMEATGVTLAAPPPSGQFVPDMGELPNSDPGEHLNVPTFLPLMFLHWAAGELDVPYQAMLMTGAFVGTSLLGLIAYSTFRSAHVMYAVMVAGSIAAIFVGDGIWGWVVPITFAVTGLLYVVYKAVSK